MPDLPWFVYAMLLAPLGLLLVAAVVKTWQAREARSWPQVPGKVVTSVAEMREVRVSDDDREEGYRLESRNFANVTYEYSAGGRKLRNNRISIGEDLGNFQVAEKLAKYPAGSTVTVYYNPRHPDQAVLERDLPKGLWGLSASARPSCLPSFSARRSVSTRATNSSRITSGGPISQGWSSASERSASSSR